MYGRMIRSEGYTGTLVSLDDAAARALPGVTVVRDGDFAGIVAPTERLARREFPLISEQLAYGFRDVHDHLVRLSDEAMFFQDRITSILDAHLSSVSNQLNQVMKVLTVLSTIFMPLTLLTGMWGMNVPLPHLPGGEGAQFWWLAGGMVALTVAMLAFFRAKRWI